MRYIDLQCQCIDLQCQCIDLQCQYIEIQHFAGKLSTHLNMINLVEWARCHWCQVKASAQMSNDLEALRQCR
ncbi:MAG: hypothetical protein HWQ38_36685 [Nostoc sp. NMS7]|uniref:hypothetical protein n=1 Tax=Nostoc sp. NMS7 TaxID=2815391 RepID=UPI0025E7E650|nr:hypothetical protein [Nostoc sp. NMS7]MBN3951703.1 hypothetical protein [Nostoc sp. NMS7]